MTTTAPTHLSVPYDNVMFLLRNIAGYRRTSQRERASATNPEISEESKAEWIKSAEEGERIANGKEQVLFTLLGEQMVKILAQKPEAQPGPEPSETEWTYKSPNSSKK